MASSDHTGDHHGSGSFPADPMHQFEINRLLDINIAGFDISFTNSALFMLIAVFIISFTTIISVRKNSIIPSRMQSIVELSYEFVADMVRQNVGSQGKNYFPFIFTLFMFVLFLNMLGMIPYGFTVTSHIAVTFALAMLIFIGVTIIGFVKHGLGFFGFFVPKGVPIFMLPLLVVIEVISYFTRPISLSVRLFANMMAGHTMLKVFSGFVILMGFLGGWLPLAVMVAFTGLEILIAFLQAYVFAILTCIYLNDALHMH